MKVVAFFLQILKMSLFTTFQVLERKLCLFYRLLSKDERKYTSNLFTRNTKICMYIPTLYIQVCMARKESLPYIMHDIPNLVIHPFINNFIAPKPFIK